MIEITNPVPVFDEDHNVIAFKYNNGFVIHDCSTNTLNVSYFIIRELMVDGKPLDQVLIDLNNYFNIFDEVRCYEQDFLLDLIKDLVVKVDNEKYHNHIFWFTREGYYMMEYNIYTCSFVVSSDKIWSVFMSEYGYNYNQISYLCTGILSEYYNLDVVSTNDDLPF